MQDSVSQLQMESGMTLDLIKSQLMMENTATAGFNVKGDDNLMMGQFGEEEIHRSLLVRDG